MKNDLPIVKTIDIHEDIEVIKSILLTHQAANESDISQYHISEYYGNWDSTITDEIPEKINQLSL